MHLTPHPLRDRLIVALDLPTLAGAEQLIQDLTPFVGCFKIGLELLHSAGTHACMDFIDKCGLGMEVAPDVFVDCKLSDIPNTVRQATAAIARHSPRYINVMADCGPASVRAAVEAKRHSKILVVTVLTSHDAASLSATGIHDHSLSALVRNRMIMSADCGADGVVWRLTTKSVLPRPGKPWPSARLPWWWDAPSLILRAG